MTEYTPTTEEVRLAHAEAVTLHEMVEPRLTGANDQFDRWLAGVEAAAEQRGKEQGWDEGYETGIEDQYGQSTPNGVSIDPMANPYRDDTDDPIGEITYE